MLEDGVSTSKRRSRREELLAAHARLLDDVLSGIADHVYMSDLEGRFIYVSPSAARLLGRSVKAMLGRTWRELGMDADIMPHFHEARLRAISECCAVTGELSYPTSEGDREYEFTIVPLEHEGRVDSTVTTVHDVSEHNHVQRELFENEQRFEATFQQAAVGMATLDLRSRFVRANDRLCEFLGYRQAELQGLNVRDVTDPRDIEADLAEVRRLLDGEIDSYCMEKRYRRRNGQSVWAELTATLLRDPSGEANCFLVMVKDVHARKAAEEEAHEARVLADGLNRINELLLSTLDTEKIIDRALAEGARTLGAETAAVATHEGETFRVAYIHGWPAEVRNDIVTDEQDIHGVQALQTLETFAIDDTRTDPRVQRDLMEHYGIKSLVVAPLIVRGEGFGCLYYNYTSRNHHFSSLEVDFVRKLASSLSLALQNARHFEDEHRIAETLQQALLALPDKMPGIRFAHAYHSATEAAHVGGDFYDLFELEHGLLGVTVGDISGKGLDASVLTSLVKNTIRAHACERGKTPSQIMRLTNAVLLKESSTEAFATVFFGILDRRDGRLVYCNAGHTATMVLHADGMVAKLNPTSPICGAFADVPFQQAETCIERGGQLFLYTDGLVEARRDGRMFGEERLIELLRRCPKGDPTIHVRAALGDALAFAGGRLADDLAILAIERAEMPEHLPLQQKLPFDDPPEPGI